MFAERPVRPQTFEQPGGYLSVTAGAAVRQCPTACIVCLYDDRPGRNTRDSSYA